MTPEERQEQFETAIRIELRRLAGLHRRTATAVRSQIEQARKRIREILADAPSEYTQVVLAPLIAQIDVAASELGVALADGATAAAAQGWNLGQAMVDNPLARGGIALDAALPALDTEVLFAQREFLIDRMTDVGSELARKIRNDLALHLIGAHDRTTAVTNLQGMLRSSRRRALTIVNTEVGRAYSIASQSRMQQATELVPGLKKQWRRSFKRHSRLTHDAADGQVQDVNDRFWVGGERLMHPRDPRASAANTINCGCTALPFMEDWEVSNPAAVPFTNEELVNNPFRRNLQQNTP